MGFVQNWIDRNRRRELERINHEIEELKRRGPDFVQRDSKEHAKQSMGSSGHSFLRASPFVIIIGILIIGLFAYYYQRASSLEDDYDAQEEKALVLQNKLDQALLQLNKTESELGVKRVVEANLSFQYSDLQKEVGVLQVSLNLMNKTLNEQNNDISNLNKDLQEKDDYINDLKRCIKNNTITDKEDCL